MSMGVQPKWQPAVDALNTFIYDPESVGINVAFESFPLPPSDPQAAASIDCSGIGYSEPAVPMGPLPDNAQVITDYVVNSGLGPIGIGTPMESALKGATQYCAAYKQDTAANPEGLDCVVVLVTDGMPEILCAQDPGVVSDIAGTAYANSGIRTFAIGMDGADFTFLNMVGQKSNADCTPEDAEATWACDVSQTGGAGLVQALNAIRQTVTMKTRIEVKTQVVDCEWVIPEPPANQLFDRDKVNFQITTGVEQPVERLIKNVDSADQCEPGVEAWYYDKQFPEEPTKILVCPETCETIRAEERTRIDILLGCETLKID
jgi:uncharacterized protein YegL